MDEVSLVLLRRAGGGSFLLGARDRGDQPAGDVEERLSPGDSINGKPVSEWPLGATDLAPGSLIVRVATEPQR